MSLSTALGKQRHSVLEYTSSLSLFSFLTLPPPSSPSLTSYPPNPPTCLTYTPLFSQCFSHPCTNILSSLFFFVPFICPSLSPRAPFYPTFLSSAGSQTAERLYTKAFCSSPHPAPSVTPAACPPLSTLLYAITHLLPLLHCPVSRTYFGASMYIKSSCGIFSPSCRLFLDKKWSILVCSVWVSLPFSLSIHKHVLTLQRSRRSDVGPGGRCVIF